MRKVSLCLSVLLALSSCAGTGSKGPAQKLSNYAAVRIGKEVSPYLEGISENGREVLNLYRFAAMEADKIYWKQAYGDKALLDTISDARLKDYAMLNYGPWDRLNGSTFIAGYESRPQGLNFYPQDMTAAEFESFADEAKTSPYTLIKRNEEGQLETVWFHEEYKENIDRICSYLNAAADLTIVPSVREYLLAKIESLKNDDYTASNLAWLEMDDSKMDLVLGPVEEVDDDLYGIKRSYSAYVVLKDVENTEKLRKFTTMNERLQSMLPVADSLKKYVPSNESNIFVCDALYYAGAANAGIKNIAISLPFDTYEQTVKGTRTMLFKNVMTAKFDRIIFPLASILISEENSQHVDIKAFFWNTVFREVAHSLGVKSTYDNRDVWEALGSAALPIEEAKADIIGAYLSSKLIAMHETNDIVTSKDAFTTFLAGLVRGARFGAEEGVGQGNLICYSYLKAHGAFERHHDNRYYIDFVKAEKAVESLIGELLLLQANGDAIAAAEFVEKYAVIDEDLKLDFTNMGLEQIPSDIKFSFVW